VDRLCHALVHPSTDVGLAVMEIQVEADQEAVALEQDGMETRVGRVTGEVIGRWGSVFSRGGWRHWRGQVVRGGRG